MSTGPEGEKRPADAIGNVVKVMRIATGEEADPLPPDDWIRPGREGAGPRRSQTCRFYVS